MGTAGGAVKHGVRGVVECVQQALTFTHICAGVAIAVESEPRQGQDNRAKGKERSDAALVSWT